MYGKILIQCELEVLTGMHIGGSAAFSAIGAVDSPVVRDVRTGLPIVPGSTLKGKLRSLIVRSRCPIGEPLPDFAKDDKVVLRMFGRSQPVWFSRLQFADAFLTNYEQLRAVGVTEVKAENTINRLSSEANPRQIERVIAGSRFGVNIVYNVKEPTEIKEDLETLASGMKLLELDYLGGHGSRGSGRVSLKNFHLDSYQVDFDGELTLESLEKMFENKVGRYELFSVKAGV